jgi:hypothetical protein
VIQAVEYLPGKHEALSSNSVKKQKRKEEKKEKLLS